MPRSTDDFDDDRPRYPDDDRDYDRPRPRKKGMGPLGILLIVGVVVVLCGGCLIGGTFYGVFGVREAANRMKSSNNLKQFGLAIHNYNDVNGELPPNIYSPEGKPLLSWRVHLLPYLENDLLYRQFKLDEPWDSPNNIRLLSSMPPICAVPVQQGKTKPGLTHYRGFSSPGAVFEPRPGPAGLGGIRPPFAIGTFKDGTGNTILVVEAADPVEWTKPDDLDASPGKPFPKMGGFYRGNKFHVLLDDGSVRLIRADTPETTLRALVTHGGGETLPAGWDE